MKKSAFIYSILSLITFLFLLSIPSLSLVAQAAASKDDSQDINIDQELEGLDAESLGEESVPEESVKQKVIAATVGTKKAKTDAGKIKEKVSAKTAQTKKQTTKKAKVKELVETPELELAPEAELLETHPTKETSPEEALPEISEVEQEPTTEEIVKDATEKEEAPLSAEEKKKKEKIKERVKEVTNQPKNTNEEFETPDLELLSLELETPGETQATKGKAGEKKAATGEELASPELEGLDTQLELPELSEELALPEMEIELPEMAEGELPAEEFVMTMSFGIPIPYLGTIVLDGFANFDKGTFGLTKTIPGRSFGPLDFDPLYIALTTDKGLTASTKAHLFGQAARLALDNLLISDIGPEALFSLSLDAIIDVPVTPWKKVPISAFYLHLNPEVKELYTLTTISTPNDTKLSVNLGEQSYVSLYTKTIDPSSILGFLKGTEIEALKMSDCEIRVYDPFKKGVSHTVALGAMLALSQLDLGPTMSFDGIYATATLDKEKGFNLMALLPTFTIPHVGPVRDGKLRISNQKVMETIAEGPKESKVMGKTPTFLSLEGLATINLPMELGSLDTLISATLEKKKFSFSAYINKDLQIGDMPVVQPKIVFSTDGTAEIIGGLHIGELEAYAHLKSEKIKGKQVVTFYGTLKNDVPLKPFESIPGLDKLPGVRDLAINNVRLGISADKNIYFEGMTRILGLELNSRFKKTKQGAALWSQAPPDYSLANFVPGSQGTILDQLKFEQFWLAASSADYYDKEYDAQVKKGFTLVADVKLEGAVFGGIKQLLVGAPDVLKLHVSLGKTFKDLYFLINVPMEIKLSDIASLKGVGISITGEPPAAGGIAKLHVKPTPQELLIFTAEFSADPTQVKVAGTMEGMWKDPLGVKGFTIGNLAAEVGLVFITVPPLPVLGVTGEIELGSKKVMMALKVSPNLSDVILMGKINELGLGDIISLANVAGANIPENALPFLGLKDVDITIAPKGGSIGQIQFDPGFTIKGLLDLHEIQAKMAISVGMEGILAQGVMKKLKLGPLEVNRGATNIIIKGEEGWDGPIARLAINLKEQQLYISGRVALLSLSEEVDILVNKDGYSFKMEGTMYGIYKVRIESKSVGSGKSLDFWMKGSMDTSFVEQIEQKAKALIEEFQRQTREAFDKAQNEVRKINSEIEHFDKMIGDRQQTIDILKRDVDRKNEEAKEKVRGAKRDVESAQGSVNSLQNQINDLQRQIDDYERKLKANLDPAIDYGISMPFVPRGTLLASNDGGLGALSFADLHSSSLNDISEIDQFFGSVKEQKLLAWSPFSSSDWEDVGSSIKDVGEKAVEGIKDVGEKTYNGIKYVGEKAYYVAEITRLGTELAGVYVAKQVADGALETAKGILKAAEALAFDPTIAKELAEITKLGIELSGLEIPRASAIAARETTNGILEGIKQTTLGLGEAGKLLTTAWAQTLRIKKASLEGSINKLVSGELPLMKLDLVLLGSERELEFMFDFKNIPGSIESMAKSIFQLIKP